MQTTLWPSLDGERVLVADESGEIGYRPQALEPQPARGIFAALVDGIRWRADDRRMYDRTVAVPRLVAGARDADGRAAAILARLQTMVESILGERFNSIGLNRYRNEHDSVAWHHDTVTELVAEPTIALLSLGAVRRMQLRSKRTPRRSLELDLEPGSLFVMRGASQRFWEHRVPKETRPIAERISIAFRQRPQAEPR